ncbi:hypothetical protein M422DRAFT_258145 [Sphaerobolus stellatus SS14]|uniref:Anaphase-promoting complex subunit 5 n=1 Tax=Sphaerobolus stellatus (strain SS14) TaxID=990650 RepID=A0A0C9U7N9_SPHS4|nr:hypothetical protein M422DRAFT_258145 [Sphaerobolus stellatus SS14]
MSTPTHSRVVADSPLKRKRVSSPTPPPHVHKDSPHLLLALPALLAVPPTHPNHVPSLQLSLLAAKRCIELRTYSSVSMSAQVECRAWTTFVEIAMKIVGAGLSSDGPEGVPWARGLETEIGSAVTKALALAQKYPSLRLYKHHLTLQHAQLAHWQHNYKFARALLRRHATSLSPSTDPHPHFYTTHLALVNFALSSTPVDIPSALHSINALVVLSEQWNDPEVALLAKVIKLRALVSSLRWAEVFPLLQTLENELGLIFIVNKPPKPESSDELKPIPTAIAPLAPRSLNTPTLPTPPTASPTATAKSPERSTLWASLELHILNLGVLAYVHAGRCDEANIRVARLHTVLDSGVLEREGIREGVIEVPIQATNDHPIPLLIHTTHPRVLFHLAFLVSAVAMRDATGRKPKPKVFAIEGLKVCDRERPKDGQKPVGRYLSWVGLRVRQDVEERLTKIEADLLCELVSVCIQRSEFSEAEEHISRLIAHTRTHNLWSAYAPRIALYHGHLAHLLLHPARALDCYALAVHLASQQEHPTNMSSKPTNDDTVHAGIATARFIRVAAQAGEVGLRLGMIREGDRGSGVLGGELRAWGGEVARECRELGGTLEAVGRVLEACLTDEILAAKNQLKTSLSITTGALDNHLRALVLALVSAHYIHTATDYAEVMLGTARQLAAGLGAPATKPSPKDRVTQAQDGAKEPRKVGNARLGLWVGERFLEIYRRTGRDKRARQQTNLNAEFVRILQDIGSKSGQGQKEVLSEAGKEEETAVTMDVNVDVVMNTS